VILSDFSLPQFDGLSALNIARPGHARTFLSFSSPGTIGEERAGIDALLLCGRGRLRPEKPT